jgi:hypothetical protein
MYSKYDLSFLGVCVCIPCYISFSACLSPCQKKKKKEKLSKEPKKANRQLSQRRLVIEHIHRRLKIFRILSSRYRNRRRRFGLRLNLIAGIYNYELRYRQKDIS